VRTAVLHFVVCNLYLSGQLVKLTMKAMMQNDREFTEVIHLY